MATQSIKKLSILLLLLINMSSLHAGAELASLLGIFITTIFDAFDTLELQEAQRNVDRVVNHTLQEPDFEKIQKSLKKRMQTLAGFDAQSGSVKVGLANVNKATLENTRKQGFATHKQAKQYAFERQSSQLLDYTVNKAVTCAHNTLATKQSNNKEHDKQRISEFFTQKIAAALSNKKPITSLLQNLELEVDIYIRSQLYPHRPTIMQDYSASAPAKEEFTINEILPRGETDITAFKNKTTYKKIYEQTECGTCHESFTELGNRVTLRCGHQVCCDCLLAWMKQRLSMNLPPNCPAGCDCLINQTDFNQHYLESKV